MKIDGGIAAASPVPCPLPANAFLRDYARAGAYTDCFATELPGPVSLERYVTAFYTTPLFKVERLILRLAVARPSTDDQARQLACGALDRFAAWSVEKRAEHQLLLRDMFGNTCSWLMVEPVATRAGPGTRLYFGSAVVPKAMGRRSFKGLLWFHTLYSRALLHSARRRVRQRA